jgi:hypothetical protein
MSTTKYIVNNVSGQTINGQQLQPYKVYTALLTQSGGDDIQSIDTGTITIGVTYRIANLSPGMDFTNVGAPNNEIDTYFVATGTTPASWGSAEDTGNSTLEYNTGAPVATVLENTIGNIWFQYNGVGNYTVTTEPESLFPIGKTICFLGSVGDDYASPSYGFLRLGGPDRRRILTQDFSNTDQDGMLFSTPIEIRVYN